MPADTLFPHAAWIWLILQAGQPHHLYGVLGFRSPRLAFEQPHPPGRMLPLGPRAAMRKKAKVLKDHGNWLRLFSNSRLSMVSLIFCWFLEVGHGRWWS